MTVRLLNVIRDGLVRGGLTSLGLAAALGCEPATDEEAPCPSSYRIISGDDSAAYLGLSEAQRNAVVFVQFETIDGVAPQRCSGVVVDEGVVLTAGHCSDDREPLLAKILVGSDATTPLLAIPVRAADRHADRDLMLLYFDHDAAVAATLQPLQVAARPLQVSVPAVVQLAGYGVTETQEWGRRRFVAETLADVAAAELTVDGRGVSGACEGDSGGPLLLRDEAGRVRVYGVLSRGESSCRGLDVYVRTDTLQDWNGLDALSRDDDALPPAACGAMPDHGRCFGQVAASCEAGEVILDPCGDAEACGWDEDRQQYGCIAPAADPCLGISDLGVCDGERARRCADGHLVSVPCDVCADSCGVSPTTGRVACLGPPPSQ